MAAKDDDEITNEEGVEAVEPDVDPDAEVEVEEDGEPDPDELDVEDIDAVPSEDDDDDVVVAAEEEEEEEDDADETPATRTKKRAEEEEDEDDDLLSPDDVEADLDRILKDRMVTVEEEDEDEEVEPDERGEAPDRLQPKRADEQLCPSCFLLVRATAPACPVGDDACPIFTS